MVALRNFAVVTSLLLLSTGELFGVEEASVVKKYALVGIIANGTSAKKHKGIAVIKDTVSKRSLTVSVGDFLPYSGWKIHSVERDRILVSNGKEIEEVRYNLSEDSDEKVVAKSDDAITSEDSDSNNSEVIAQRAWDHFYRNRDTSTDFDRKVTVVVAEPGITVEATPPQPPSHDNPYPNSAPRPQASQLSDADALPSNYEEERMPEEMDAPVEPLIYAPH